MKTKEQLVKNDKMLETARRLRRDMTPQERKLWYAFLRSYPVKIYKQRIIESYVVDFYCAKAKLIIELDGPIHDRKDDLQHDANRDERLRAYGLDVLRIANCDVENDFSAVCAQIEIVIRQRLPLFARPSLTETSGQQPLPKTARPAALRPDMPSAGSSEFPGSPEAPPLGELAQRSCD